MSVPRLGIIASLLAAFVAGILVGVFLIGNAGPPSPVGAADGARDSFIAATGRAVASRPASELASVSGEAPPPALSGDELIAQFWTTLTMADENARHAEWLRLMKSLGKDEAVKVPFTGEGGSCASHVRAWAGSFARAFLADSRICDSPR